MKYFILSILLFVRTLAVTGEPSQSDTASIRLLIESAEKFIFLNTDSSIRYAQQSLLLAEKSNLKQAGGQAFYLLGGNYWIMGNYPKALSFILQALQIFEKLGDQKAIADTYRALASIYRDQSDYSNALLYAEKCKSIAGKTIITDIYTIIGSIYEKSGNLDSAIRYLNMAAENDLKNNGKPHYGYIPLIFGNVYYKKQDYLRAIRFYDQSIALLESQKVYKDLMEACNGMAKACLAISKTDSGIAYAKKTLDIGRSTPFQLGELEAADLISQAYRSRNNFDSTVRYMELSMAIKDSLYNQQKAREFQTLVFKEQIREQKMDSDRIRAEEDRSENIQLLAIAAFIPLFFLLVVILRRKKIKPGVIEFMVLVGLLLFFEFISLLIHPWLESRTHHTPVLMLLALVLIAAILVPSHHRLEGILKKKLAKHQIKEPVQVPDQTNVI
ncbi:MAG TPA: tetratricopeptide repeat protein [Puia sp.]|nr:tetratricopeptide repeat protein [Puia sp.]